MPDLRGSGCEAVSTWPEARAAKAERLRRERRYYTPQRRGPDCWACGKPTAKGTVDEKAPYHPCCAEQVSA